MRGSAIAGILLLAVGGFMLADVVGHPAGTRAAGSSITGFWKTTAQGVSGQRIS